MSYRGITSNQIALNPFTYIAIDGQTVFSGADFYGITLSYTPYLLRVFVDGVRLSRSDYIASDGSSITLNFSLSVGQILELDAYGAVGINNVYTTTQSDAFYTQTRNRFVNPCMQISQELGTTLTTFANTNTKFICDQWFTYIQTSNTAIIKGQQVASVTPSGSSTRYRISVTTTQSSLGSTDLCSIGQRIEGQFIQDFRFGSASAKSIIVRIGCNFPAGTWPVSIRNGGAYNRTWLGSFTIAAGESGTDVIKYLYLTADTTGTWVIDNTVGIDFSIAIASGSSVQGTNGWQSGNLLGLSSGTNGLTAIQNFDIFDMGFYLDINNKQVSPPFELPKYDDDLRTCQRYFHMATSVISYFSPIDLSNIYRILYIKYPTSMRVAPTITLTGVALTAFSAGFPNVQVATTEFASIRGDTSTASQYSNLTSYILNARM